MKKIFLILFFSASLATAAEVSSEFYEPNISNDYQGRLLYDSLNQDYPIDIMTRLCEPYTGIDTAQIKCKKQSQGNITVCEYKCSMHWLITK